MLDATSDMARSQAGSVLYMSPEVCDGLEYNSKTDVWLSGRVKYEFVVLEPAFHAPSCGAIIKRIQHELPSYDWRMANGRLRQRTEQLVHWLLQKNAGRRPTAAAALAWIEQSLYPETVSKPIGGSPFL